MRKKEKVFTCADGMPTLRTDKEQEGDVFQQVNN